ncbi:hypothetical protein [Flavobacterium sp.]|uniref:hypothetical protein n=1 Tax=Flavobacterium sp. TaxID=239 RepID=UPI00286E0ADD|nr:hypothetical protein [Flavobacterium sp.]
MAQTSRGSGEKSSSIGNHYTSFFVNDSTMLYYIKPMRFNSINSYVNVDFTFNKIQNKTKEATMNFSIITPVKISISSIKKIKFNDKEIQNYKILYNESKNKKSEMRISSSLNTDEFMKLDENSYFEITTTDLVSIHKPSKKTYKILKQVKNLILD